MDILIRGKARRYLPGVHFNFIPKVVVTGLISETLPTLSNSVTSLLHMNATPLLHVCRERPEATVTRMGINGSDFHSTSTVTYHQMTDLIFYIHNTNWLPLPFILRCLTSPLNQNIRHDLEPTSSPIAILWPKLYP